VTAYTPVASKQFRKDLRRLNRSKFRISDLEHIVDLLAQDKALPERYHDHELTGALRGIRECHVAPDWLLIYKKEMDTLVLLLLRTGTHRQALGIE